MKSVAENALLQTLVNDERAEMVQCYPSTGETVLNFGTAHGWMQKCGELNELISFLMHTTSGQLGRGTEVSDARIRNRSRHRNLMINHDELMFIINYTKTSGNQEEDSYLPHQLCSRLKDIMHHYLLVIRPMETRLSRILYNNDSQLIYEEFLMVRNGKKVESEDFTKIIHKYSLKYFGVGLKLLDMRHLWVAMKREYIHPIFWNHQIRGDDVGDLQAGHTSATANRLYALSEKDKMYENTSMLQLSCQFSRRWHDFLGVGFLSPGLPLAMQPTGHVTNMFTSDQPFKDVIIPSHYGKTSSEQTASNVNMTDLKQNLKLHEQSIRIQLADLKESLMINMRQEFQSALAEGIAFGVEKAMEKLQCLPVMTSTGYTPQSTAVHAQRTFVEHTQKACDTSYVPQSTAIHAQRNSAALNHKASVINTQELSNSETTIVCEEENDYTETVLDALSVTYTGKTGQMKWRSEGQKRLVCWTHCKNEDVLGVIPTGGGKSAAFEVPGHAYDSNEITIVICPFNAILNQFYEKNRKSSTTKCIIWTSEEDDKNASQCSLVFVSADSVRTQSFRK